MAHRAPVPALRLELDHADLLAALVPGDDRLDPDLLEISPVEDRLVVTVAAEEQRLEVREIKMLSRRPPRKKEDDDGS